MKPLNLRAPFGRLALSVLTTAVLGHPPCASAAARLTEIVALAQANDPQYAAARASMEAGREKYVQGRAGLLPTIHTQGSARAVREANTSHPDWVNYKSGTASITLTQPLLRKANYEAFRQGELQAQLAELQFKLAEQDLLVRISKGYFDVLQAQDVLASVRAQKDAFAQQLAQADRSFNVGVSPITDVNEAQSRYDLTLAQEIAALNDLEVKRRTLEKSVKTRLPELATLDEAAMVDLLHNDQLGTLVERAPNDALQVAIGQTTEQIARRDVDKESAAHWPTVDLVASKSENEHTSYGATGPLTTRQTAVGVEVSLPLFQGGAVSSRAREAAANLERTRDELETARRQATFDAGQAMLGVQSGLAMNRALKQALRSNEVQVRSTRRGLEVGVRTRVDVLNAEQQLYATKKDLAAARYQTVVSGLQLKAAAGVLTLDDLQAIDQLLTDQR
jgi:outer membrane protein